MPDSLSQMMDGLGRQARSAARMLAMSSDDTRNAALHAASAELRARRAEILKANATDVHEARERDLSAAMLDRLMLDDNRIEAMAAGLDTIAGLPDPLGRSGALPCPSALSASSTRAGPTSRPMLPGCA